MIVDPLREPNARTTPSPLPATQPPEDADEEKRAPTSMRERWARIWPTLLAGITLPAVGGPAAVASYRHARDVIADHGDPMMAPWLALTTDGMLLAALVVIWVRRHRGENVKAGPWAAFWTGMAATMAANLAAAQPTPVGIVVALWPPVCLAITLELVAVVASQGKQQPIAPHGQPTLRPADVPKDVQPEPGHVPAGTALEHRAPTTDEAGHDTCTDGRLPLYKTPTDPAAEATRAPAAAPAGGHVPVPTPAPDQRDAPGATKQVPVPASGNSPGRDRGHEADHNGDHGPVRTGRVPDSDILAWLRQQTCTTGKVPGRRKVIKEWATGSTRAERLRRIVVDEATSTGGSRRH